jgi:hypothetical protein
MARAVGLPARVAVGYATGDYLPGTATYVVKEADAHSWTQIYFPEYGWIDFEPTPPRRAPDHNAARNVPDSPPPPRGETEARTSSPPTGISGLDRRIVPAALLAVILAALVMGALDGVRLRRLPPADALARLYHRAYRYAVWVGLPVKPSSTPHQLALLFGEYLGSTARPKWLAREQTRADASIAKIVELYVDATYGARVVPPEQASAAIGGWQAAQGVLVLTAGLRWTRSQARRLRHRALRG